MTNYNPLFSKYYDYLVHDCREAYATEDDMAFLKKAFADYCEIGVSEILDVGCGTGRYVIPLAKEGFNVTGIDNSPEMLAQGIERSRQQDLSASFHELDLMDMRETCKYDALLCMNSVICYFHETKDIIKALTLFRNALRPGGILVLEIWNIFGNAASFGSLDVYETTDKEVSIICRADNSYDSFTSIYHTTLDVTVVDSGMEQKFIHDEYLRAMTVGEVTAYLEKAGFASITVHLRKDTLEPESGDEEFVFLAVRPD